MQKLSTDKSTSIDLDIVASRRIEMVRINLEAVHKSTAAFLIFLDGSPRNFNVSCNRSNT